MTAPAARRAGQGAPRITPHPGRALPRPWANEGLCAQADPDTWFPDEEDHETAAVAIAVCARCPVSRKCLAHALDNGERHGIWGGLTAERRRALHIRGEQAA